MYVVDLVYSTEAVSSGAAGIYLEGLPAFVSPQYGLDLHPTAGKWERFVLIGRSDMDTSSGRLLLYSSATGVVKWRYAGFYQLGCDCSGSVIIPEFPMVQIFPFEN
jgi:hypothetical protein